jgi:hypothetical protein
VSMPMIFPEADHAVAQIADALEGSVADR